MVSFVCGKAKVAEPEVPASLDTVAGALNCQHCSAELFWAFVTSAVAWR